MPYNLDKTEQSGLLSPMRAETCFPRFENSVFFPLLRKVRQLLYRLGWALLGRVYMRITFVLFCFALWIQTNWEFVNTSQLSAEGRNYSALVCNIKASKGNIWYESGTAFALLSWLGIFWKQHVLFYSINLNHMLASRKGTTSIT